MNLADQKKTDKIVPVDIFNKNLFTLKKYKNSEHKPEIKDMST